VTADLKITIPFALTVSQIIRHVQAISANEACQLACELHDLVAAVRAAYATCPPDRIPLVKCPPDGAPQPVEDLVAFELADVIEALRSTVFGVWPTDDRAARAQAEFIEDRLTLVGGDALYLRYLRLCGGISPLAAMDEERPVLTRLQ
jgi:hypothetical protein